MTSATTKRTGLVFWLPIDEATRRFAVSREELAVAVRRGELDVRAKVIGGEVVASVSSAELSAKYGAPRTTSLVPLEREEVPPAPEDTQRLEELHGRVVEAEDRARVLALDRARLEGRLETADRMERGLQRYADRLEQRLEDTSQAYERRLVEAEHVRLQLARVVGRMESEMGRMQLRLDELEGERAKLLAAAPESQPEPAPRRRWPWSRRSVRR